MTTKLKMLLVEDDKVDQMAFRRLKNDPAFPFDLLIAGSFKEARELLESQSFDVVVTDFQLGDGNGLDVLSIAKELPVVVTTGGGDEEVAVKAMKAGASDYLIKDPERNYLKVMAITVEKALHRKKVETRVRMLTHAVMNITDSVYITDLDGQITFVNNAFTGTYKFEESEVLGKTVEFLWDNPEEFAQLSKDLGEREFWHRSKDGNRFPVSLSISVIQDEERNEPMAIVGISRDITERKKNEQLRVANQAAEETSRAKSRFLANMSHELRTPLNHIIGYTEILGEELEDRSDLQPDLRKIQNSAKQLMNMISGILEISKIEMGQAELSWEDVKVAGLMHEVLDIFRSVAEKHSNQIDTRIAPEVQQLRTDRGKIHKVLSCLVENACKFTSHGSVSVEVEREGDSVLFHVRDSGIGMTPDQVARVFEPFTQADDSSTREYSGTGLGLTLARQYCRLLNGDISVKSEPGRGSTFTLSVPIAPRQT